MYKVKKRDGKEAAFDISKIIKAIQQAFDACGRQYTDDVLQMIALRITSDFEPKIKNNLVDVEAIQDSAEKVLMEAGYPDVSKAYILYRKQRENIRNITSTTFDYKMLIDGYLEGNTQHETESSSEIYSVGGLILSNSGAITMNYWLSEAYDEEVSSAHKNADIHIHDLNMLTGDSAGWSLYQLIREGLAGIDGSVTSSPAKHLSTLCIQMVNFFGILQNEWAGAQSFSSFDTYLAPFIKANDIDYEEVKSSIQSFVYGVNIPSRWGTQAPFTNITLDWIVPKDLAKKPAIVGGKEMDFTYGDCQKEMDLINKAFMETMIEGDGDGMRFHYPISTYSLSKDFSFDDNENTKLLFEMAAKYGTPYFANYMNSPIEKNDVRTFTPRTKVDYKTLYRRGGGYFGSGENTGSIGVVTINLPRIAYQAETEEDFFARLDHLMELSARCLNTKREILTQLLDNGLFPYTKRYIKNFDHHFSSIGIVGMNEACLNAKWVKKDLSHEESLSFAKKVLEHMREKLLQFQTTYKCLFSLEATPAEGTAYRLAKRDKEEFEDIVVANMDGTPYYTNSSNLPVGYTDDIFAALDIQQDLQVLYTSGTSFHIYLGERMSDEEAAMTLVEKIAENYHIPYFTLTPTYSICSKHGYIAGEVPICPKCQKPTEIYSRITGYYRPLKRWNEGKKQEYKDRKPFLVE